MAEPRPDQDLGAGARAAYGALLAAGLLALGAGVAMSRRLPGERFLDVAATGPAGAELVAWCEPGPGSMEWSARAKLPAGEGQRAVRLRLAFTPVSRVRLEVPAEVEPRSVVLVQNRTEPVAVSLEGLRWTQVSPGGPRRAELAVPPGSAGGPRATAAEVWLALALFGGLVALAWRTAGRGWSAEPGPAGAAGWLPVAFCALVVLGSRLYWVRAYGVSAPFWDEWESDVPMRYALDQGTLTWPDLFRPNNEHRVLLTRLVALALHLVGGQCDSRVEMALNVGVFTAPACFLAAAARRLAGGKAGALVLVFVAFLGAMPFAHQNLIWGFQNQLYFLLLLTLLTVAVTFSHAPQLARTAVGGACAVVGLYTVASGVMTALVAGGLSALAAVVDRPGRRWHLLRLGFYAVVVVAAAGQWVTVEGHQFLRAHGLGDLVTAFARWAAWPFPDRPWAAMLMWLPFLLWLGAVLWRRGEREAGWALAAVGGWVIAQMLAGAYARGVDGATPASRYMDLLAVGPVVNLVAGCRLARLWAGRPRRAAAAWAGLAAWGIAATAGVAALSVRMRDGELWGELQSRKLQEANVRGFLVTGSPEWIAGKPWGALPYHDNDRLMAWLHDPFILRILPASMRAPLVVAPPPERTGFQPTEGDPAPVPAWSSAGAEGPARWRGRVAPQSSYPYLRVDVRGAFDRPGMSLELAAGGKTVPMTELKRPRRDWFPVYAPKPQGPFDLVARDEAADFDFAFSAPVEVSRLTYWTECLLSAAEYVIALGAAFGLAWAVAAWRARRRPTGAGTA